LKGEADSSRTLYYDMLQHIKDAEVVTNFRPNGERVMVPARPSFIPVYPRVKLVGAVVFLLSSLLGVGLAVLAGTLDRSVKDPEQVKLWFDVPVLGVLPRVGNRQEPMTLLPEAGMELLAGGGGEDGSAMAPEARRRSAFHEAVLSLHTALQLLDQDISSLVVTSSVPEEGKSTVAVHIAAAFARLGKSTLLIDADLRRPSAHRKLGLPNRIGLSSVLCHKQRLDKAIVPVTGQPNLHLLPAGPAVSSPAELLLTEFPGLLEQLRLQYDVVIADSPPVLGFADAQAIANTVEAILLVARAGQTQRPVLAETLRHLRRARARLLGLALNYVSRDTSAQGYYYHSYYSKYYRTGEQGQGDEDEG
jgi:succinoglycan biosynthesis transport protein ExoP